MSRRASLQAFLSQLEETVLRGPGEASAAVRAAAAQGEGDGLLGAYAKQVQVAAYRVTGEQMTALQVVHSDDVIFEVTVAASFGAAKVRHEAGLAALDAAFDGEAS